VPVTVVCDWCTRFILRFDVLKVVLLQFLSCRNAVLCQWVISYQCVKTAVPLKCKEPLAL